jgi:hypothetical protein
MSEVQYVSGILTGDDHVHVVRRATIVHLGRINTLKPEVEAPDPRQFVWMPDLFKIMEMCGVGRPKVDRVAVQVKTPSRCRPDYVPSSERCL